MPRTVQLVVRRPVSRATTSTIITWLYRLDSNFINLLKVKKSIALIIVVHNTVLFHELSYMLYYHQEWGPHLISTIAEILDSQHTQWLS